MKKALNDLQVEYVDIDSITPYVNNAKLHPPEQINQIAASMKEFGFTQPILIDETNTIIAGHGRLEAALKLDIKQVPVIRLDHLTTAQKKAYIIADNKLTLNSGYNNELLKLEFEELNEMNFDLSLTGFSLDEIKGLDGPIFAPNLPNENSETPDPVFKLLVTLADENQQQLLFDDLLAQGYKVKVG